MSNYLNKNFVINFLIILSIFALDRFSKIYVILGDGEIQSVHRSTETLGENIDMDIGNLNRGKDKTADLSMLEGFNTYTYIR